MGLHTPIGWTDHSWPIVNGCRRKSPGCQNCYAEGLIATRLRNQPKYKGLAVYTPGGPRWTGEARLWEPDLRFPLEIAKPSKIFVADMGDLFYEEVPDEWIATVFGVMSLACHHTYQVLTKRPERALELLSKLTLADCLDAAMQADVSLSEKDTRRVQRGLRQGSPFAAGSTAPLWPLPNVWLGTSVENQETAQERITLLLQTPAAVRFVSAEPLLGEVDLEPWLTPPPIEAAREAAARLAEATGREQLIIKPKHTTALDWVIVGGESGRKARACCLSWIRNIVYDCAEYDVACFVKQMGSVPYETTDDAPDGEWPIDELVQLKDSKGSDPAEWDEFLRVQQFPKAAA